VEHQFVAVCGESLREGLPKGTERSSVTIPTSVADLALEQSYLLLTRRRSPKDGSSLLYAPVRQSFAHAKNGGRSAIGLPTIGLVWRIAGHVPVRVEIRVA
jgi:hypothetical protein